jgi:hypothetical protein
MEISITRNFQPIECASFTGTAYQNCLADFQDKALVTVFFPDVTQFVYQEEGEWDVSCLYVKEERTNC